MRLDELLTDIEAVDIRDLDPDAEVNAVTCDSRKVTPGCIFVAVEGTRRDGHEYIPQALAAGASLVVQSRPLGAATVGSFLRVREPRGVYALLCARLLGHPSQQLRVIGVTGTNGKTSTVLITRHLLCSAGHRAAALGTLGLMRPEATGFERRGLTTPDAAELQSLMRELVDDGVTHLVMEVSSHALAQHRVAAVEFTGAVFTNVSQDHFDYHGTREAYVEVKSALFTDHLVRSGGYAVLNTDDEVGRDLAERFGGIHVRYGCAADNNLVISGVNHAIDGLSWELFLKNGIWPSKPDIGINQAAFKSRLTGRYNVHNCVAAAGVALLEGLSLPQVVQGIASFGGVPGRMEVVANRRGIHIFVDYAHTPHAVENVLRALTEIKPSGGRIITVIGCGGDRDAAKRPLMGLAAQDLSDLTIVTSDNPRTEDPEVIIDQILAGVDPHGAEVRRESDRRSAIRQALDAAGAGDVVLIAGKGHEDYQILPEGTVPFSDVAEARDHLATTAPAQD